MNTNDAYKTITSNNTTVQFYQVSILKKRQTNKKKDNVLVDAFAMLLVYKWAIKTATATPLASLVHFFTLWCFNAFIGLMPSNHKFWLFTTDLAAFW